jgi:glyoxylase-like metal-dependent hydrolase (beta-lactamase superfamily II)
MSNSGFQTNIITEMLPGIFLIPVPLPRNPLKELNAYLVKGNAGGRNLLIDTGFNRPECEETLRTSLKFLNVDMDETDLFITHMHSDHCGLINKIASEKSTVWCSKADGDIIKYSATEVYWYEIDEIFGDYGYPRRKRLNIEKHPGWEFNVKGDVNFTQVDEGFLIEVGEYKLRTVWTPGHTPGHMCLYDESKKLFFAADHVLGDITPNITIEIGMEDPLRLYLDSLKKVAGLDVETVLTGHRSPPKSFLGRIEELKAHHIARLEECMQILNGKSMTAYEVAAHMTWDIVCDTWEAFPTSQKWFATGEAIAHLQYLYTDGRIRRFVQDGIYYYSRLK